ncbi:hypothetical protein [Nitratiruptor sp. SB155-2]|uniref:hypothetical protein n=1 Tax=Nitratiruptor sp. (strain SB155-2) TaxID=387092 RepID=UPI0001587423|nr:hypothetical protein [Nitratiruptor sp. SB155-2]BAF69925.1 conserved hypothetical protein [Nitratiruptor sp. SB155-2]
MAKTHSEIKLFNLYGTKEGIVSVAHITEPYGPESEPVVSIGISLKGNALNPEWKVHIPYENIDDLIEALELAKKEFGKDYIPDESAKPLDHDESIGGD